MMNQAIEPGTGSHDLSVWMVPSGSFAVSLGELHLMMRVLQQTSMTYSGRL
jgi:hypothetical protein